MIHDLLKDMLELSCVDDIEMTQYNEKIGQPVILTGRYNGSIMDYPPHYAFIFNDREFEITRLVYGQNNITFTAQDLCSFFLSTVSNNYFILPGLKLIRKEDTTSLLTNLWLLSRVRDIRQFIYSRFRLIARTVRGSSNDAAANFIANIWDSMNELIYIPPQLSQLEIVDAYAESIPPTILSGGATIFEKIRTIAQIFGAYLVPTILTNANHNYAIIPSTWPDNMLTLPQISGDIENFSLNLPLIPSRGIIKTAGYFAQKFDAMAYYSADDFPNYLEKNYHYIINTLTSIPLSGSMPKLDDYIRVHGKRSLARQQFARRTCTIMIPYNIKVSLTSLAIPLGITTRVSLPREFKDSTGNSTDNVIGDIVSVTYDDVNATIQITLAFCITDNEIEALEIPKLSNHSDWPLYQQMIKQHLQSFGV